MTLSEPPQETGGELARWLIGLPFVLLATAAFAAADRSAFRPPAGFVGDFTQDWLSARDVLTGRLAYGNLPDAMRRHFGRQPPEDPLQWNAHPPGSILLALPLAPLDHEVAFFAWNLITFPLFVVAVWIAIAELGPWRGWRAAAAAGGIAVLGVTSYPLHQQVVLGQFNALLAFLIAVAWVADRRGWPVLAGVAVGAAAAVKLFPAFLFLYLLAARRWRAVWVGTVTFAAINAAAAGLFGVDAYRTYAREVVPAVSAKYATQWNNLSTSAFWLRLFDPTAESRVVALATSPLLGKALATAAQVAVAGLVALAAWRARSVASRDRAFALAVVGMLLASPITWPHSLVMLVVPLAVLAAELYRTKWRWALAACVVILWLPDNFLPAVVIGREQAELMSNHRHEPLTPLRNLLAASVPHYALVGLFLLGCFVALRRDEPGAAPPAGA